MSDLASLAVAILSGGAAGAAITWVATNRRESSNRRRKFRCKMIAIRSDLDELVRNEPHPVRDFVLETRDEIRLESAMIEPDIACLNREEFMRAQADYRKLHQRAERQAAQRMAERIGAGPAPDEPRANPPTKQELLELLNKLIELSN